MSRDSGHQSSDRSSDHWRSALRICAVGVALRAVFLLLAGDLEFQSDEANYVYLAVTWKHFGFFTDSFRYYWPPGYSFLIKGAIDLFGDSAPEAVKWLQVLASASIGWFTMALARRLFCPRTARIAGWIWVFYLPLIGYTHFLWSETLFLALFLPSFYLLLRCAQEPESARDRDFVLAGGLMAAVLYLKDAPLYFLPVLAGLIALSARRLGFGEGLRRALVFGCATLVWTLPWTLRNYEVYGRFVPIGKSLGENVYVGMNEEYKNFDLTAYDRNIVGARAPSERTRPWFVEARPGSGWRRAEEITNTPDRFDENTARGLEYASEHPRWFVRTRIKKLADLVAPQSFVLRHQGLGHYARTESPLGDLWGRRLMTIWVVACPVLLLLLGLPALFLVLPGGAPRLFFSGLFLYFGATSLLVSMSRFRLPLIPFLIVLAAGLVAGHRRRGVLRTFGGGLCLALLLVLWWIDAPEVSQAIYLAWRDVL